MVQGGAARGGRAAWFELSEDGWRRENRARPLGQLLREALQNAFDHRAGAVEVRLGEAEVSVEDDAPLGLARDEYAFTVFLGEKDTPPTWRGRKGRGLKELIASSDAAQVQTVARTISFDAGGRRVSPNGRTRGTLIRLFRRTLAREREEAARLLRLTIPPAGTLLRVGGREVRRPRPYESLEGCVLETVEIRRGMERAVERSCRVDLYRPRAGERAHLFEMGLPVEPIQLPWHADVQQRIPLAAERDAARDPFKPDLCALVFESLAPGLSRKELSAPWVSEVLSRYSLSQGAIEAYARKVLPARAVLSVDRRTDDRARQLGATVVDVRGFPASAVEQLAAVVEMADAYVSRMEGPPRDLLVDLGRRGERLAALARWLSRELTGREVAVEFFEREARDPAAQVDAEFDSARRAVRINVRGRVRLDDPLHPENLAILLHELAHDAGPEHDFRFIRRLESLAGRALHRAARSPESLAPFRAR